jgi:putative FmdB family regulatory protein
MTTCEYECMSCGYRFEKFKWMSEEPVKRCPCCGHEGPEIAEGWFWSDLRRLGISRDRRSKRELHEDHLVR